MVFPELSWISCCWHLKRSDESNKPRFRQHQAVQSGLRARISLNLAAAMRGGSGCYYPFQRRGAKAAKSGAHLSCEMLVWPGPLNTGLDPLLTSGVEASLLPCWGQARAAADTGQRQDGPMPWGDGRAVKGSANVEKQLPGCAQPLNIRLMKNL